MIDRYITWKEPYRTWTSSLAIDLSETTLVSETMSSKEGFESVYRKLTTTTTLLLPSFLRRTTILVIENATPRVLDMMSSTLWYGATSCARQPMNLTRSPKYMKAGDAGCDACHFSSCFSAWPNSSDGLKVFRTN
jgi:hypothetical protein